MRVYPIDRNGLDDFVEIGSRLHPRGGVEVPALRAPLRAELAGESAFAAYGKWQLFACERDGAACGRIGALVNPRVRDSSGSVVGQLGYFECIDDGDAARALFDAGMAWLRTEGAREVLGPMNGGAHRAHRLMTRGFDLPPFLFEPRNPRYYVSLFEANGFEPAHRWASYEFSRDDLMPFKARMDRLMKRFDASPDRLVYLDASRTLETLARIHPLLDRLWAGHLGYAPIELAELAEVMGGALSLMGKRHIGVVVDRDGRDVACSFMYPDYVDEVRALDGDVRAWGAWLGTSRAKRLVMHTLALIPERRGTIDSAIFLQRGLEHFFEEGFDELIVALVVEQWPLFKQFKPPTREYALYRRTL